MRNIVGQTPRGDDFFPRTTIVSRIYNRLQADAHVYLAAPRRVGKTAIMRHLEDRPRSGYTFKYLITESVDDTTTYFKVLLESMSKLKGLPTRSLAALKNFLGRINEIEVAGVKIGWDEGPGRDNFVQFKDLIKTLDTDGTKMVIMVDEFPQTVKNILQQHDENAAKHFLQLNREIRHEAHHNIRFMLTGSIGLPTMAERLDATEHINDLRTIEVSPLSREEAQEMTTKLLNYENIPCEVATIDYLLNKIEWFIPFHIQLVVQELIDGYIDTQESVNTFAVDKAFDKIGEMRNDIYFAHYYSRLKQIFNNNEYDFALAILNTLAQDDAVSLQQVQERARVHEVANYAIVLRTLAFDGYIFVNEDNGNTSYRFTSPVLRLWWRKYVK